MDKAIALLQKGLYTEASIHLETFLQNPIVPQKQIASAYNLLGFAYQNQQAPEAAVTCYQKATALYPENAEYANNLAIIYAQIKRPQDAYIYFEKVLNLKPDAESHLNLAFISAETDDPFLALQLSAKAHELQPDWASPVEYLLELMNILIYHPKTLSFIQHKLVEFPEQVFYQIAMGVYYHRLDNIQAAQNYFKGVLEKKASYGIIHHYLINNFHNNKNYTAALEWALLMYQNEPTFANARLVISSIQEPIPSSKKHVEEIEKNLNQHLDYMLDKHVLQPIFKEKISITNTLSFYHCYQFKNLRPIQEKLAQFYSIPQIVSESFFLKTESSPRPRLGIVSHHLYDHSVMSLLRRSLDYLMESDAFEVFIFFYQGPKFGNGDQVTEELKNKAQHFQVLSLDPLQAIYQISQPRLDILIYPEVGMDPFIYTLASQRMARFQMVMSGHPVTTGLKSMDYFISSQDVEIGEAAQAHYSETLIQLKGLPDYAAVIAPEKVSRSLLALPEGNLYFCPMTLFKIHPDFDFILGEILEKDPQACILFLEQAEGLHLRLAKRFQNVLGLEKAERIHFIKWSERSVFYQRLMACDVVLDSFYFGGGNTAYQALSLNCPIITLDLPWNRSRWTQAMYRMMGMTELVASSPQDYVVLALKLANDKAWNTHMRCRIQEEKAVLFDNPTWSKDLLKFCQRLLLT